MALLTEFLVVDLIVTMTALLYFLYWYQVRNFNYWKDRGVPFIKPHWFFGNMGHQVFQRKTCAEFAKNLYNKFKSNGYGGIFVFRKPAIVICESGLIEKILTQDFSHFQDRSVACNPDEALSGTLFSASGEKWRRMRLKLIPTFSSGRVRGMFNQIFTCGENLIQELERSEENVAVNIEPLAFNFVTDVIASCAFGVQLMSNSEEGKKFRHAVDLVFDCSPLRLLRMFFGLMYPKVYRRLGIKLIPNFVTHFFINLTQGTIMYRKKNNLKRNDFLQMMLDMKEEEENGNESKIRNRSDEDDNLLSEHALPVDPASKVNCFTEKNIASLVFNFLSAGVKPASAAINFTLFELAKNPEVQKRLQEEVDGCIEKHGKFDYQSVKEMTYLDQIIQEIHRLYTSQKCLTRCTTGTYRLPGTSLTLEKGTIVYIPISAIHKDPELHPSPEEFNPDRFIGNNFKPSRSFMPYGHGPRICIGIRFAVLLIKVFVARIIVRYTVSLETELPLQWDKKIFCPEPKGGIRLLFDKRSEKKK